MTLESTAEFCDVDSSNDDYATRFAGPVGAFLLDRQTACLDRALRGLAPGTALDVGGGHAQLVEPLQSAGWHLTVLGSDARCRVRPDRVAEADRYRFVTGPLTPLPFADDSFDVVTAFRMLAHVEKPDLFIAELCRVARHAVVVDYATPLSFNALAPLLFGAKQRAEGNTRPFATQSTGRLRRAFGDAGWDLSSTAGQFFWPMVVHRKLKRPGLSRALEAPATALGLRAVLGSPRVAVARPVPPPTGVPR